MFDFILKFGEIRGKTPFLNVKYQLDGDRTDHILD